MNKNLFSGEFPQILKAKVFGCINRSTFVAFLGNCSRHAYIAYCKSKVELVNMASDYLMKGL